MKQLFLIRGLPGAGKTTLANLIADQVFEADQFFEGPGGYNYDRDKIKQAHTICQFETKCSMSDDVEKIAVSNTFAKDWEMEPYIELANKYGYTVTFMIVENRHEGRSVHGVPNEVIETMRRRFDIAL